MARQDRSSPAALAIALALALGAGMGSPVHSAHLDPPPFDNTPVAGDCAQIASDSKRLHDSGSINCGSAITSTVVSSNYNLTTASGTQTVSGFGFTPSTCDGFGTVGGATGGGYTSYGSTVDSALNQGNIFSFGASIVQYSSVHFFSLFDSTTANSQLGNITAYGSGSVTITWTKGGSPTGTFTFTMRCLK